MKKNRKPTMELEGDIGDRVNGALVPVIDVSLVLVIVFSALCPMAVTSGIKALESHGVAGGKAKTAAKENVEIMLTKDKVITVNNLIVNMENLSGFLSQEIPKSKTMTVMLTADKENIVDDVVKILDISKQSGAKKVIIMRKKGQEAIDAGGSK